MNNTYFMAGEELSCQLNSLRHKLILTSQLINELRPQEYDKVLLPTL
jgi:hypothetical protein